MKKRLYVLTGLPMLLVAVLLLLLHSPDAEASNPARPTPSVPATLTNTVWIGPVYNNYTVPTLQPTMRPTPGPATPGRPTPAP
jgi:hypothetical protein